MQNGLALMNQYIVGVTQANKLGDGGIGHYEVDMKDKLKQITALCTFIAFLINSAKRILSFF